MRGAKFVEPGQTIDETSVPSCFQKMRFFVWEAVLWGMTAFMHSSLSEDCGKKSSGNPCSTIGSLHGTLTLMEHINSALGSILQTAREKADVVGDSFCVGNRGVNTSNPVDDLCSPAEPDCSALRLLGFTRSGVYRIWPKFLNHSMRVYCDMDTADSGWTVIQRRGDYGIPRRNFYETWENYKKGFGNIEEDFWLGNDAIFALTNQAKTVLRIDLEDFDGQKRFAIYPKFLVRSELEDYRMTFEGYEGDAGDSLATHNGKIFITKDKGGGCANEFKGGWWYAACHEANLNGLYHLGDHTSYADGVNWYKFRGYNHSMKHAEMKIKPCSC